MLLIMFTVILSSLVGSLLILMWVLYSNNMNMSREKLSPFECGFDPVGGARTPFSLRFFLLAVIFLIFDIEIVLLLPAPIIMAKAPLMYLIPVSLFLMILLLGTMHEYKEGSLDWTE